MKFIPSKTSLGLENKNMDNLAKDNQPWLNLPKGIACQYCNIRCDNLTTLLKHFDTTHTNKRNENKIVNLSPNIDHGLERLRSLYWSTFSKPYPPKNSNVPATGGVETFHRQPETMSSVVSGKKPMTDLVLEFNSNGYTNKPLFSKLSQFSSSKAPKNTNLKIMGQIIHSADSKDLDGSKLKRPVNYEVIVLDDDDDDEEEKEIDNLGRGSKLKQPIKVIEVDDDDDDEENEIDNLGRKRMKPDLNLKL